MLDRYDEVCSACYYGMTNGQYTHQLQIYPATEHRLIDGFGKIFSDMVRDTLGSTA